MSKWNPKYFNFTNIFKKINNGGGSNINEEQINNLIDKKTAPLQQVIDGNKNKINDLINSNQTNRINIETNKTNIDTNKTSIDKLTTKTDELGSQMSLLEGGAYFTLDNLPGSTMNNRFSLDTITQGQVGFWTPSLPTSLIWDTNYLFTLYGIMEGSEGEKQFVWSQPIIWRENQEQNFKINLFYSANDDSIEVILTFNKKNVRADFYYRNGPISVRFRNVRLNAKRLNWKYTY